MRRLLWSLFLLFLCIGRVCAEDDSAFYLAKIKPVLKARCYACHGALKQESEMRLDTAVSIRASGVIESGELLARLTSQDPQVRMPPEGEPLDPGQLLALRRWIEAGAPVPVTEVGEADPKTHWAFQPIVRPTVPRNRYRHPVDAFLEARRSDVGVRAQPAATRLIQLRRLYLDLVGVPPSLEEIEKFLAADPEASYEAVVQQLLADSRYGERWGRHWMDIWRYSDWWGLGQQLRNSQKHIWHWRDWIVESLNEDLGYDEMVRQMLAADELYPNDLPRLRAGGYLARNWFLFNRNQWMNETVEHVAKGFLGLTLNCCKCHDHKFDPLPQVDFYRFRAFFEPYHVRTDLVPGVTDVANDGIARPFDGLLDAKTYVLIRGDEKRPDESVEIVPGVPSALGFADLDIESVKLPSEAAEPQRRDWIARDLLDQSRDSVEAATKVRDSAVATLRASNEAVAKMETDKGAGDKPSPDGAGFLIHDRFETLDDSRWKLFGGNWEHKAGELRQTKDGAQRAALRLVERPPRNFEVALRFTITGGSMWRSVGIGFDSTQQDPSQDFKSEDTENQVYVSAYARGSKVHASNYRGGKWNYPAGGMRALPIELGKQYTLRLQVRGALINAFLDDRLVVAWRTPLARKAGAMQLTTFDVLPVFHEFRLKELDESVVLTEPDAALPVKPVSIVAAMKKVREDEQKLALAESELEIAAARHRSLENRIAAWQSIWTGGGELLQAETHAAAVRAERRVRVLEAMKSTMEAGFQLADATADKKMKLEESLAQKQAALAKAEEKAKQPVDGSEMLAPLVGASWSATRFAESRTDDPQISFPASSTGRRSALARWITDRRNPLAARVAVNHIWLRHMGQPLVGTMFDFGLRGDRPTHPLLLDWLAAEWMDNAWSMKELHRIIVTSDAYRMSSSRRGGDASVALDRENRLWWRRGSVRLESQVVRDSLLSLAGTLDPAMGGPPVLPDAQAASMRRSLYFFHSNNSRAQFLTVFDEARVTDCYRRESSIVPQQALALSNSRLVLDSAESIATLLEPVSDSDAAFVVNAFRLVLAMEPGREETEACLEALAAWQALPDGDRKKARSNLVWSLLNHSDYVTLR